MSHADERAKIAAARDARTRADQQAKILATLNELSDSSAPGEFRRGYNLGISAAIRIVKGAGHD